MGVKIQMRLVMPKFSSFLEASPPFCCCFCQGLKSLRLLGCERTTPDMLTRNKLLICNTSLYGLSARSSYQRSISQQAWPPYHIPDRVQALGGCDAWKPLWRWLVCSSFECHQYLSVLSPFPCFLSISKKSYHLLLICFGLQYKTNPTTQQFIVPAQPQAHTDNTNSQPGRVRRHAIGPTMTRIFHLVHVQKLFCDIWVNFCLSAWVQGHWFCSSLLSCGGLPLLLSASQCVPEKDSDGLHGWETFHQNLLLLKAPIKALI